MEKITIPFSPRGQQRPRFTSVGKFHKAYKSKTQKAEEDKIKTYLLKKKPARLLEGPLNVTIDVYEQIPKSWPKWKQKAAKDGEIRPTKKPDIDNLAKQVLDCMNGIFWQDDKQVVGLMVRKFYAENPRCEIQIKDAN